MLFDGKLLLLLTSIDMATKGISIKELISSNEIVVWKKKRKHCHWRKDNSMRESPRWSIPELYFKYTVFCFTIRQSANNEAFFRNENALRKEENSLFSI